MYPGVTRTCSPEVLDGGERPPQVGGGGGEPLPEVVGGDAHLEAVAHAVARAEAHRPKKHWVAALLQR